MMGWTRRRKSESELKTGRNQPVVDGRGRKKIECQKNDDESRSKRVQLIPLNRSKLENLMTVPYNLSILYAIIHGGIVRVSSSFM